MKSIKIGNETHVLKFTSKAIVNLGAKGINLVTLGKGLQNQDLSEFYQAFYEGLKTLNPNMTFDRTLELIDIYFEDENNEIEELVLLVMEEFATAMGLGKAFKKEMQAEKEELEKKA
ncbi:hypothetical protein ANS017_26470 [Paraclostridium bifermentans]|uniref:hypothetical protein n=1 Tax=Paraclostridium bifermentans TaxID=1490 RepID=UPI0021C37B24|nr:hypothetical protein [Paraclostridium bifermentans]GKZ04076.1 hypothetical protein ANS014_25100 [Paraclostridium bifermentans]GKZ05549.1 hypothetical protein ANS015_04320 [Paraclostridium bifermentans]GKZ11263.1 hypothetical protein ANS017_26470 [Paraclostridium bifermentans]